MNPRLRHLSRRQIASILARGLLAGAVVALAAFFAWTALLLSWRGLHGLVGWPGLVRPLVLGGPPTILGVYVADVTLDLLTPAPPTDSDFWDGYWEGGDAA